MSGFAQVAAYGRGDAGGLLSGCAVVAGAATCQPERARAFYSYVLGLALVDETPLCLLFEAGGTRLLVRKVRQVIPAPYACLGWVVADIAATVRGLMARGVACERLAGQIHDAGGIWLSPSGERVAWFRDPDGNLLTVTEYPER